MQEDEAKIHCEKFAIALPENFWDRMKCFVELIIEQNYDVGLIAPGDMEFIWERHILDSLSILLFEPIHNPIRILDFGSGGGFPGIVLACARPQSLFILSESSLKKASFIQLAKITLDLQNVVAFAKRAEEIGQKFDLIVIRATGPLTRTLSDAIKLAKPGGRVALWAGPSFSQNLDYWKNFCEHRKASIKSFKYPDGWLPGRDFSIAFISRN